MQTLVITLHVIACVILIVLVLLQSGKEGMGVIFGGGSSSLFGSTGAGGILVKLTTFMAVIFLVTSLGYNIISARKTTVRHTVPDIPIEENVVPPVNPAPEGVTPPEAEAAN